MNETQCNFQPIGDILFPNIGELAEGRSYVYGLKGHTKRKVFDYIFGNKVDAKGNKVNGDTITTTDKRDLSFRYYQGAGKRVAIN